MSQETTQAGSKGARLLPISCSVLLFGTALAFLLWQFQSWNNVWLWAQFFFWVMASGILVGWVWQGLLGKGKSPWSNLAGIVLFLFLFWCCSAILEPYNNLARERFTTGEKTVKWISLALVGLAVMLGRDLAQRFILRNKR